MSKLEELIEELCPDEVEFKELQEILTIKNGRDYKSFGEGNIPVYGSGGIMTYVDHYAYDKPSVLIPRKGSINKLYYVDTPFWNVDTVFYTEINADLAYPKYVYYCLQKEHVEQLNTAGGVPSLTQKVLNRVSIPIPPLEVQSEIVRILDNFTELTAKLTAELTAELIARKKQYEYYRDELFGKDYDEMLKRCLQNNIKVITLEKLGKFTRGKRFVRNDIKKEGTPCIHYGDLYTYYGVSAEKTKYFLDKGLSEKMRFAHKGDVVIVQAGENDMDIGIGVAWMGNEDVAVHDACYIFEHNINPKYISHYLRTNIYHLQIKKFVSTGKICSISAQGIGKALIPVPSIEEQDRIVDILDRFDALCNDISTGLHAEIEARQKQYEYYHDKLLTFKELS